MDRDELTQSERPGKLEEQVPTSPCASYEKPRVPLNNLKMKFERGEDAMGKVVTDRWQTGSLQKNACTLHLRPGVTNTSDRRWHPLNTLIITLSPHKSSLIVHKFNIKFFDQMFPFIDIQSESVGKKMIPKREMKIKTAQRWREKGRKKKFNINFWHWAHICLHKSFMNEALSLFFIDSCASIGHVPPALTVTTALMIGIYCTVLVKRQTVFHMWLTQCCRT